MCLYLYLHMCYNKKKGDFAMKKFKKLIRVLISVVVCLFVVGVCILTVLNAVVKSTTSKQILSSSDATKLEDVDCILILGCLVRENGVPSGMLHDRLTRGIELYNAAAAPKLLMSGDHGRVDYDEVAAMKKFALDAGVPSIDVFMDHAGFSTYESIYRAKEIFQADKILIVTQGYHLYRALYIANQLGIEAYGVSSDYHRYGGQFVRDAREVLARVKDFAVCVVQPEPTYLGEVIPIFGDGNFTNDDSVDFT